MDPATGMPTYENKLVPDEWGMLCDPDLGGYDIKDGPQAPHGLNPYLRPVDQEV